ncbi:MAG: cyclic nucleotide-binding domain-containing protein [Bdellovibrionota bacterium]
MNTDDLNERLKRFLNAMHPIPESEWQRFTKTIQYKHFQKGDYYCRVGEVCRMSSFIGSGFFEAAFVDAEGNYAIRKFYSPGQAVSSYRSLITGEPSEIDVVSLTDSYVTVLAEKDQNALYEQHPVWVHIGRRFGEIEMIAREKREKDLLLKSPEERYLDFIKENEQLIPHLTDKKISAYLGITNVSLSRLKKRLTEK